MADHELVHLETERSVPPPPPPPPRPPPPPPGPDSYSQAGYDAGYQQPYQASSQEPYQVSHEQSHQSGSEEPYRGDYTQGEYTRKPPPPMHAKPAKPPPPPHPKPGATSKTRTRMGRSYSDMSEQSSVPGGFLRTGERKGKLSVARLTVSLVAVALLWITSLSNVIKILQGPPAVIATPLFDLVLAEADAFFQETLRLRTGYIDCVAESLFACNISLAAAVEEEQARSQEAAASNEQLLLDAQVASIGCEAAYTRAVDAVKAWAALRPIPADPYVSSQCEAQIQSFTGGTEAQKAAAYQLADDYSDSSKSTVELLANSISDRAAYDRLYLYNKTLANAALDQYRISLASNFSLQVQLELASLNVSQMLACTSMSSEHGVCAAGESAREAVQAAQDRLYQSYTSAKDTWGDTVARAEVYSDQAVQQVQDAAATISAVNQWMADYFPELPDPSIEGVIGVPVPDLNLGSLEIDVGEIPSIEPPPALDDIYDSVKGTVADFEESVEAAASNLNLEGGKLQADLGIEVDAFADYDPPEIDAGLVKEKHANESDSFKVEMADSIRDITAEETEEEMVDVEKANATGTAWLRRARDLQWFTQADLTDPGFDWDWIFDAFAALTNTAVWFDVAYRAVHTVLIFRQFWGRSALPVPPVDVMKDDDARSRNYVAYQGLQGLAMAVTSPPVLALLGICWTLLTFIVLWSLYKPILDQYYEGCVRTEVDPTTGIVYEVGTGTLLSRNVYAIAFNFATFDGNRDRLDGLDNYDSAVEAACAANTAQSAEEQAQLQLELNAAISNQAKMAQQVGVMADCYNLPMLDQEFVTLGVTAPPYNYPLLSYMLSVDGYAEQCAVTAAVSNSSLQEGSFDCSALPACPIACDELADEQGNDLSALADYSIGASCTAEWWFHGWALKAAFSLVIYAFVNIFRVLTVMGLSRILWRKLNTGYFAFLGTCDINGKPGHTDEELHIKLVKMLSHFKQVGLGMLLVAAVAQVPWIVALVSVVPRIAKETLT